ncbi:host cell division inhibitor Icd-like protein [Escherichia coli]|nr:host cell division inhibitor Icd-like protein [Escherichia coli]ELK0608815.1 host cell division inhibitor Icd-like protein [Escherichia coli]ELK0621217.1 host cell division inhibitor Icd-like protein [Escherichia coli]ELK0647736.1 host cell division inhibitor Icd-like protein [Escherichia coli]MCU6365016.1 host cell division inhibitor Icd-like protein [Escherichia coli]
MILNEPAAQKEAFNLASLLTNVNPQNLIKPKVVNDYLLSIVMAKDLAKLSLNLSKPDIHARGMTTNDDILNQEIITSKKLIVGNKFPLLAGGMNWIATVVNRSTSTFATNTRALEDLLGVVTREGEFSESIKKSLPLCGNTVYGYSAPAKSGAGIGVLQLSTAHNRAKCGFFVCVARLHPSMVGWARASKDAPVSVEAGTPTSFSSPPVIGVFGGDFKHHSTEAAAMLATIPTQKPQFIWIIAAVRRDMPTITAKIHHIAAETEQEARRILARDHVCFFAGRIRLEVAA